MGEDRLIQAVNPAAQRMFGYAEDELVGKNVKILMPSPYHEEHDGYVEEYVKTGKKKIIGIGREVIGKRKDGSIFPLELSVAELQLANERIFTGILRDVTDRKRAEDELLRVNERLEELVRDRTRALEDAQETLIKKERLATLGQLAGSVAHEIRNPLGIVRNAAYYVEETTENPSGEVKESFEEIRRGLERADRIISELLDFARAPESDHREFVLGEAIEDALQGVEIHPQVEVETPEEADSLKGYGNPVQIAQIIKNLVINSIQAMPEGGSLRLHCKMEDDDSVVVEVEDTGTGIDEDQLNKIFEPLFTTKTRGIGLGLALSRRYAELNRATLSAESTVGKGSVFRLRIPTVRNEDETP